MKRLTFEVKSAPYLAIRCLHQLSEDEKNSFPLAAPVFKEDFLVDNLLSGSHDVQSARAIQDELLQIMERGNLKLRKWMSNFEEIVTSVPQDHREGTLPLSIDDGESVKTIGLLWLPATDTFGVSIVLPDLTKGSSKRKVLSSIARVFDPLGWLSPVTIKLKTLMQELWKSKLDWDSPLPPHLHKRWVRYCEELKILENFCLDRCIIRPPHPSTHDVTYELHGFSDASGKAYSATVYVRTPSLNGQRFVTLVAAKSKVAPIKLETSPSLELGGAVLLSKLMKTVQESVYLEFRVSRCWSDNTGVLGWLGSKDKLPIFMANRVRIISNNLPSSTWHHVAGEDNPADCASRGISAEALVNHPLWFHGPPWLSSTEYPPTISSMVTQQEEPNQVIQFIKNCSFFPKMKRVLARCLRFLHNSKRINRDNRRTGPLEVEDLDRSLKCIVTCVQAESFPDEIKRCMASLISKTSVKFLSPFLDKDGILRVGGRLDKSSLSYSQRHPILLPKAHEFTQKLVRHSHFVNLHAAPQLLLAIIRDQFWIVGGADVVRRVVRSCTICHRHRTSTSTQIMGHLPPSRINPSRPFSNCGLDYAGPFTLCLQTGRTPKSIKSYVCLFVCMATRAIHLEWASDLTTAAFIGALQRFVSRRGRPSDIFCDGGTNFVGAKNEMEEIVAFLQSKVHQDALVDSFVEKGIKFHFNPPGLPHHGGLWEAGVKAMKTHLKRVIGERRLSVEEFNTLLCQVEACLNSRPLSAMSNDPNDFSILTPGHFLTGDSLLALPQRDITHLNIGRLSRWQAVQQIFQHFWKRWSMEYLSQLQQRPKWYTPQPSITTGTLVLLKEDDPAWGPTKWKLGRVVATYPGKDGFVRVCDVKTSNGSVFKRPIVKLSPLPIIQ